MDRDQSDADEFERATSEAFSDAMDQATVTSFKLDFPTAVQQYQAVQAEFLARVGNREIAALEIRRRIAELILQRANVKNQPFEVCQQLWNDLLTLGFTDIDRKCTMSWFFVDCCRMHRQVDIGLAVLDPLLAELKEMMRPPKATRSLKRFCKYQIGNLSKLRAQLEALRDGADSKGA